MENANYALQKTIGEIFLLVTTLWRLKVHFNYFMVITTINITTSNTEAQETMRLTAMHLNPAKKKEDNEPLGFGQFYI